MPKYFKFPELVEVYENQIAASMERTTGRNLLADELSCLSLWLALTKESSMEWSGMSDLMQGFRYRLDSEAAFKKEFAWTLHTSPKELDHGVYRFDLARQIFLERGL